MMLIPAPSNGWCLNPKGVLNGTLSHPFGTPWSLGGSRYVILFFRVHHVTTYHRCIPQILAKLVLQKVSFQISLFGLGICKWGMVEVEWNRHESDINKSTESEW